MTKGPIEGSGMHIDPVGAAFFRDRANTMAVGEDEQRRIAERCSSVLLRGIGVVFKNMDKSSLTIDTRTSEAWFDSKRLEYQASRGSRTAVGEVSLSAFVRATADQLGPEISEDTIDIETSALTVNAHGPTRADQVVILSHNSVETPENYPAHETLNFLERLYRKF